MKNGKNNIELRSEKVRKLLGDIPLSLVICGQVILVIIIAALLMVVCFVPHPQGIGESIFTTLALYVK
jgi:hypothetical protein